MIVETKVHVLILLRSHPSQIRLQTMAGRAVCGEVPQRDSARGRVRALFSDVPC